MKLLIYSIRSLHYLIVLFVALGCFLPYPQALWFHLIFIPIMVIHWQFYDGECVLTQMERKLEKAQNIDVERHQGRFLINALSRFGITPSKKFYDRASYSLVAIAWGITVTRLV